MGCIKIAIKALLVMLINWKQPVSPSVEEQLNELWHSRVMQAVQRAQLSLILCPFSSFVPSFLLFFLMGFLYIYILNSKTV